MLEDRGFTVLSSGWPDFLCHRQISLNRNGIGLKTVGVMAVEVKFGKNRVREEQTQVHKILRAARIPVHVIRADKIKTLPSQTVHSLSQHDQQILVQHAEGIRTEIAKLRKELDGLAQVASGAAFMPDALKPLIEKLNVDLPDEENKEEENS